MCIEPGTRNGARDRALDGDIAKRVDVGVRDVLFRVGRNGRSRADVDPDARRRDRVAEPRGAVRRDRAVRRARRDVRRTRLVRRDRREADTYIASVEAPGSWQTRVDDDIAYLESESTERVADAIGAFIAEYYCPARMHVTVASADADRLLSAVRRFVLPSTRRPGALGRAAVLPRSVYKWTSWDPGSVSVIAGSAGDTTRVRFCASVAVSSDPVSVLAASCAAWCVSQTLFVELRVRSNAVYSVHAELDVRAVTNEERDGDHDAAIVVSTVCTHDKAPLVVRCIRDAFDVSPELVRDWARSRTVRVGLEPRDPVTLGERAREVSFAATNDAVTRADRLALIESVTHADVVRATTSEYRVYASTSDASPRALQRAIERALGHHRASRHARASASNDKDKNKNKKNKKNKQRSKRSAKKRKLK